MMAKVLLSDIDGTLVDSNALHAEAWRRAFEHFGIEVGMDEAWSQIGKGGDQLIPVFVPEADRERLEPEIKKFRKEVFHRDYMPRIVSFAKARGVAGAGEGEWKEDCVGYFFRQGGSCDLQKDRRHGGPDR
jgi:beta-phosphoglucomutase-like phosphatase (HAD superfamily)